MPKPIFDMDDGDFVFRTSRDLVMDSEGNLMMRLSDHMAMDLDSGALHHTSRWDDDEKDNHWL